MTALCFTAKLVPLAYGIKKLQISCVVEDDKVRICFVAEMCEIEPNQGIMDLYLTLKDIIKC